jgi:hypothetical protein
MHARQGGQPAFASLSPDLFANLRPVARSGGLRSIAQASVLRALPDALRVGSSVSSIASGAWPQCRQRGLGNISPRPRCVT